MRWKRATNKEFLDDLRHVLGLPPIESTTNSRNVRKGWETRRRRAADQSTRTAEPWTDSGGA